MIIAIPTNTYFERLSAEKSELIKTRIITIFLMINLSPQKKSFKMCCINNQSKFVLVFVYKIIFFLICLFTGNKNHFHLSNKSRSTPFTAKHFTVFVCLLLIFQRVFFPQWKIFHFIHIQNPF